MGFFKLNTFKRLLCLAIALVVVATGTSFHNVMALSETEWLSVENNGPFYLPNACGGGSTTGPGASELEGFKLPASHGYTGLEEKINTSGQVPSTGGRVTFANHADNNKHGDGGKAFREYYITMRWTYAKWYWNGGADVVNNKQISWLSKKPRLVLVTNPRTKKSIIAAALEAGPAPWTGIDTAPNNNAKYGWKQPQLGTPPDSSGYKGRVSGFPPTAMKALGAKMGQKNGKIGDDLTYSWAPDQDAKPGPTTLTSSGSTSDSSGSDSTAPPISCSVSGAGFVNSDGYAWPIGLSKADVNNYGKWPCDPTCHWDRTGAFDLAHKKGDKATIGLPVYAIYDGTIDYVKQYNWPGCSQIGFFGKDGWRYWYGHLGKQMVKPNKDKVIKAGEQIGVVGKAKCARQKLTDDNPAHLHIDRGSPKGESGGEKPHRDMGIVPLINKIYEELPK